MQLPFFSTTLGVLVVILAPIIFGILVACVIKLFCDRKQSKLDKQNAKSADLKTKLGFLLAFSNRKPVSGVSLN